MSLLDLQKIIPMGSVAGVYAFPVAFAIVYQSPAPDSWNLDMILSNIPIDDNRTLLDILPPKTDRDVAKEKLRTLIESISIRKI